MPKIRYGVANIEVDGAANGVVKRFPYIRPEAALDLAELMAKDWDAFCRKAGPLRQNKHLFTDQGLADLPRAIKVIQGYASSLIWLTYFDATEHIWSEHCEFVRFRASVKECCRASRQIDGLLLRRQERFKLALPECDAEWCSCRWLQEAR